MQEVGRNEPCPCGSGKKYKKCCASKKVVSIQTLLVTEGMDLQLKFLNEKMAPMQGDYKEDLTYILDHVTPSFEEKQFLTVYSTFMFGLRTQNDQTHWSHFVDEQLESQERPRMKEIMPKWHDPRPVLAEVIEMDEDSREMVMKDLINDDQYTVVLPEFHSWAEIDYVFAVLLPLEDKWVPYGFMFPSIYTKEERSRVIERISMLDIEGDDRSLWLKTSMLVDLINAMVERTQNEEAAPEQDWMTQMTSEVEKSNQQEALQSLKKYWDNRANEDLSLFACHIAASFFAQKGDKVRKPETYLAAISYLMAQHATETPLTQKEAGEAFDVSASSVSSTVRKIEEWFVTELEKLQEQSV
ncbi:SEC-C domain-containing protein [Jeotgalibacillus sp. ET6]|uniref:YecA family protein n=1 Tax=Jeotgalibacillus sp. ET6 TaxID=3037260 RepID=UPI00241895CF|nr:SEC-C domain-containing protein [Jeotgalibacillus sp. ET6]MDG5471631.1 SEC-C domain-containing protein [Jeotgalibacillus sp. ET6]